MKKLLLIAALLFASYGVFADEFDDFVKTIQQKVGTGGTIRAAKKARIIFIDLKIPGKISELSPEKRAQFFQQLPLFEQQFLTSLRGTADAKWLKENNVVIVYNLVSLDPQVFSVVITPVEL